MPPGNSAARPGGTFRQLRILILLLVLLTVALTTWRER